MFPGVKYRQNRYITAVFDIVHNYILAHRKSVYRKDIVQWLGTNKNSSPTTNNPTLKHQSYA